MKQSDRTEFSRRDFLKTAGVTAAALGVGMRPSGLNAQNNTAAPSERIRLGFIGVAGRGQSLMRSFAEYNDAEIAAVCDVHDGHLQQAAQIAGGSPATHKDFRRLLEDSSIDAVVIATPPHWHAMMSIMAMEAGKDVYCEKPMALRVDEGLVMAKAARKYEKVTQLGTQIHAGENFRRVVEIVRSGILGEITSVRTIIALNEYPGSLAVIPDSDPPPELDWNMWLGPLFPMPYNEAFFWDGKHRYLKACVGTWVNELGPHIMDLAFWAMDPGIPRSAQATGGRFALKDMGDIPDTVDMLFEYPDFTITCSHTATNGYNFGFGPEPDKGRRLAVIFHGTNGTLAADYGSYKVYLEGIKPEEFEPPAPSIPRSPGHQREFLNAIKTREQPPCSFEYHLPLATAIAMGHTALFFGEKIGWDPDREDIISGVWTKNQARSRYRPPWSLPSI